MSIEEEVLEIVAAALYDFQNATGCHTADTLKPHQRVSGNVSEAELQRHRDYVSGFNEGYDRATESLTPNAKNFSLTEHYEFIKKLRARRNYLLDLQINDTPVILKEASDMLENALNEIKKLKTVISKYAPMTQEEIIDTARRSKAAEPGENQFKPIGIVKSSENHFKYIEFYVSHWTHILDAGDELYAISKENRS